MNTIPNQMLLRCRTFLWAALAAGLVRAAAAAPPAPPPSPKAPGPESPAAGAAAVQTLQQLVDRWVALRRQLSEARNQWREQQAVLTDELRALDQEKKDLLAKINARKRRNAALSRERDRARAARDHAAARLEALVKPIAAAEKSLADWRRRVPAGAVAGLEHAFGRLPQTPPQGTQGLNQRLERVLKLYAELEQRDQLVRAVRMILPGPQGRKLEARVLFLGLGAAFALAPGGKNAAAGYPDDSGRWTWHWRPALAPPVKTALACFDKQEPPRFVILPLRIANSEKRP